MKSLGRDRQGQAAPDQSNDAPISALLLGKPIESAFCAPVRTDPRTDLLDSDDVGSNRHCFASLAMTTEIKAELITRSEEHTSELQSLMRISYAVFCLQKKKKKQ